MAKRSHPPVRKRIVVDFDDVSSIYYQSKSYSDASRTLSKEYGLTARAWRYRLKKFENKGQLDRSLLKVPKRLRPLARPREVMITVHFKIKYERIGKKGWHPFHLEGYYSKRLPANWTMEDIYGMMDIVRERMDEFGALVEYLSIDDTAFEQGVEVELMSQTTKRDGEFNYDIRRRNI